MLDMEEVEQEAKEEQNNLVVNNKDVSNCLSCFDEFFDYLVPHHHTIIQTTHLNNMYYFS